VNDLFDCSALGYLICVLQCVAVCCSALQCVAVRCSVLQCVVSVLQVCYSVLQVCYNVLQCAVVQDLFDCSALGYLIHVLQCIVVCCKCVAVRCSVL